MTDENLKSLIQALHDGCITESDLSELETALVNSEEARRLYIEYSEIHSLLVEKASVSHVGKHVVPIDLLVRRQRLKSIRLAAIAAVAILAIGLGALSFIIIDNQPALVFDAAAGSEFTLIHGAGDDEGKGTTMDVGSRLQISRGTVELNFASGVRSIVKAPADITLRDDDTLFVDRGTAWFEVPESAIGFTVNTEDLSIVDLGTEFGVIANPDGHDEVHVFKGKVKATALGERKESITLTAGEARRNTPVGLLDEIEANPVVFLKSLTELPPYLHWTFDEGDQFRVQGTHPDVKGMVTQPSPSDHPPSLVEGKFGSALSLNGNQQGLETDWAGIYGADRPLTTAVWVRIPEGVDLTGLPAIVGWGVPMYSRAKWKVQVTHEAISDPPVARVSIGGHYYDGQTRLDDNQWHHIAVVYHGRHPVTEEPELVLYIDGQRESLTDYTSPITSESLDEYEEIKRSPEAKPMSIGKGIRSQEITFRGLIDELYIFDGAISEEAIKTLVTKNQQHE